MVRSQEIRSSTTRRSSSTARPLTLAPSIAPRSFAYLMTAILALIAIYAVMGHVLTWGRSMVDDVRYGTPRTYHLSAVVGHNDGSGTPTHLVAMNLNRQVVIVEFPGGDTTQARTLTGPYLVGAAEDKTPVTMRLADMNGDGSQDLIVNIKNEEIVYLNTDGEFRLITAEERATLSTAR